MGRIKGEIQMNGVNLPDLVEPWRRDPSHFHTSGTLNLLIIHSRRHQKDVTVFAEGVQKQVFIPYYSLKEKAPNLPVACARW